MNRNLAILSLIAVVSSAQALSLTQVGPSKPVGSSTLFNAVGTANTGNQKARLEGNGFTTIQGGNPGNGWFYGNVRSWEVSWDNTNQAVSFKLFSSSDWSGAEATNGTMSANPTFLAGHELVGLSIGWRLTSTSQSLTLDNVQFNDGNGWVDVDSAEGTFSANAFTDNYHAFSGAMTDWTLRGTANFPTGTTTGDSMRFFVTGVQAVPEPGTMAALGLGVAALIRRRRAKK